MPGELVPIIIMPALFWMIAYITSVISDNRVRRKLAESGVSQEVVEKLFLQRRVTDIDAALKWGLVGVAIGIAFAVIAVGGLDVESPMTYAVLFIFAGTGLLGFYGIKRKQQ